jgi:hypothetical protein
MSPAHLSMSNYSARACYASNVLELFTVASRGVQLTKRVDEPYSVKYYIILQVI